MQPRTTKAPARRLLACVALALGAAAACAAPYLPVPGGAFDSVLPQDANQSSGRAQVAPFALRELPVTNAEFLAFVQANPQWQRGQVPEVFAGPGYLANWAGPAQPGDAVPADAPVTEVSWFAARAYCESEGARLPSWLEWEMAAAADATRADARSDPAWAQRILGWYERPAPARLPAVGGPPNLYGLRDLHGLVWEWVDDFNALFINGDSRTQGDPDTLKFCGAGAISIVRRDSYAVLMRVALLSSLNAADSTRTLGFRCARPLDGTAR
jgi:formylglycine-generating enzyme required for sulfatase activity